METFDHEGCFIPINFIMFLTFASLYLFYPGVIKPLHWHHGLLQFNKSLSSLEQRHAENMANYDSRDWK